MDAPALKKIYEGVKHNEYILRSPAYIFKVLCPMCKKLINKSAGHVWADLNRMDGVSLLCNSCIKSNKKI